MIPKQVSNNIQLSGNLRKHKQEWLKITQDSFILDSISNLHIEFDTIPYQKTPPAQLKFSEAEKGAISEGITELLKKGATEETLHSEGEFVSTIFTREKKNGKFRIILNLKKLNENVKYHHFKMNTLENILELVTHGCFMTSIDYYVIPNW